MARKPQTKKKSLLTEKEAVKLLKKAFARDKVGFREVLKHSKAVKKAAMRIAKKNAKKGISVDIPFIKTSCLLHDIGRAKCPPGTKSSIKHGVIGARLLRSEHLLQHAKVAERHLGAGITPSEAKSLGLPVKDYTPKTIEEKIIAHADNLVFGGRIKPFSYAYQRYKKELGKKYAGRLLQLKKEIDPGKCNEKNRKK